MDVTNLTLDQLPLGKTAIVTDLSCQGIARRRMMDLGLLPGVRVTAELQSPLRDPVAYRIRDAMIALRKEQARQIAIEFAPDENQDEIKTKANETEIIEPETAQTKEVEHVG